MPPQRLPIVDSDDGTWGDILRQYLLKEHYDDGNPAGSAANGGHKTITIRAGTASANTAPLKFTSGTLLATPEAGAIEFNTDTLYFTQTTGPTRTQIITDSGTQTLTNKTISGSSNTFSNIPQSAVTNLTTDLAGKAASSHTHTIANVTNLQTTLDGKAASSHTHTATNISDSTSIGRSVLTAANAAAARTAIGAGTGSGDVTLTGSQTLTNKTIVLPGLDSLYTGTPTNVNYSVSTNAGLVPAFSPVPKYVWHDLLRFNRWFGVPSYERYNGSWSAQTLDASLFNGKEAQSSYLADGTTVTAVRWTWNNGNVSWSNISWWVIGFTYDAAGQSNSVVIESSVDGSAWTTRHTSTTSASSNPVWFYQDSHSGDPYIRLTITTTSAKVIRISSIRALSTRWGNQGGGAEYELPYDWDSDRNLTLGATAGARSDGALNLGTTTSTTAGGGIYFGDDTNLYRSAANTLRTDDSLVIGTAGTGAGSATTIDGTQILTNKTISGSSNTLTNISLTSITPSTSTVVGVGSIELGHATDTTVSRVSAGRIAVEGVNVPTISSTDILTNKDLTSGTNIFPTFNQSTTGNAATATTATNQSGGTVSATTGTFSTYVRTDEIINRTGQQLVISAGEAQGQATGQTAEFIYLNAEDGIQINSSPDNWGTGWAGRITTTIGSTGIVWNGNTVWHAGNDGAGSGLDADTLDGQQASAFATASHTHTASQISDSTATGRSVLTAANAAAARSAIGAGTGSGDVTLTGAQVLTNKTISGSDNTITNLAAASIASGALPMARIGIGDFENLVAGSDFETEFYPWSLGTGRTIASDQAYTGTYSYKFTAGAGSASFIGGTIELKEGERLYVECWVRRDSGYNATDARIRLGAMPGNVNVANLQFPASSFPEIDTWVKKSFTTNPYPAGNVGVAPSITMTGLSAGNLWIDDIVIRRVKSTDVIPDLDASKITAGTLPVARGGTGATTLSGIVVGNGTSAFTTVSAPSSTIVGTTDTQTLSGKTISGGSNTLTNIAQASVTNLTTDLGNKVDKTVTANRAYTTDGSGNSTSIAYSSSANASTIMYRTTGGVTSVGTPTADAHATTKLYVDTGLAGKAATTHNHSSSEISDIIALSSSLRANRNISGGGTITVDGSGYVSWSARLIVIANGRGSNFSTAGYFDITCPTTGTITGVGGASNVTATAAGIPLGTWTALYYILPVGSGSGSVAGNFRVVTYTSDVNIPYDWVLICIRNGDNSTFTFNNGISLSLNQSMNSVHQSHANTANTLVRRDGSGDFAAGIVTASRFISNISTGTAPFTISSTTAVTNLNADLLDGQHASAFAATSHTHTAANISDSTATGRSVLTAANAAAARTAIGAGTGDGDVTLTGAQTLTNKTFNDDSFVLQDGADNTKKINFSLGGMGTGEVFTLNAPNVGAGSHTIVVRNSTDTLLNKRITPRVITITSSATPAFDTDDCDVLEITALATNISSMTSSMTGAPENSQKLLIRIKDNGGARSIVWGASWRGIGVTLPVVTTASKTIYVGALYNTNDSIWDVVAVEQQA